MTGEGWLDAVVVSWEGERGDELEGGGMATDIEIVMNHTETRISRGRCECVNWGLGAVGRRVRMSNVCMRKQDGLSFCEASSGHLPPLFQRKRRVG